MGTGYDCTISEEHEKIITLIGNRNPSISTVNTRHQNNHKHLQNEQFYRVCENVDLDQVRNLLPCLSHTRINLIKH